MIVKNYCHLTPCNYFYLLLTPSNSTKTIVIYLLVTPSNSLYLHYTQKLLS